MNKNYLKAGIAAVGVAGLLAGGSTYALWHDYDNLGTNSVGAGTMDLRVTSGGGDANYTFNNLKLAPGVLGKNHEFEFLVSSNDAASVPAGILSMNFADLVGTEDGCHGNEADTDPRCALVAPEDGSGTAVSHRAPNYRGQFPDNAMMTVNVSQPTTDLAGACSLARGSISGTPKPLKDFFDAAGDPKPVTLAEHLDPGQGICVGLAVAFDDQVSDDVQGDSATFDTVFKLDQIDTTP